MASHRFKEWIKRHSGRRIATPVQKQTTSSLYSRLDQTSNEIRLLTLLPGSLKDELQAKLVTVSLDEYPQYYAISHRWADGDQTKSIRINGFIVNITPTLAETLIDLRGIIFNSLADRSNEEHVKVNPTRLKCAGTPLLETGPMPIWIDSICIDQSSTNERSSQVSIMDHIYSKADVVIIRIRATRSFDEVFMPPLKHPEFLQCLKGYNSQCVPVTPLTKACKHAEAIAMMRALFTTTINFQEWWARAWVVQEVVLARKDPVVLVGGYAVMWSHFVDVMDHLRQTVIQLPGYELQRLAKSPEVAAIKQELGLEASLERPVRGRQSIEIRSWEEAAQFMYSIRNEDAMGRNMSLGAVLNRIGPHRQATDPLDNIYAYLSFLDLDTRNVIQVDYKKKPLQLYREIMALMLEKDVEQALMVVQTYSVKEHLFESDWPSWIPDFAVEDTRIRTNSRGFAGRVKWQDARPVQISKDGRRIGLQGVLIDTISQLHLVSSSHDIDPLEMWKANNFVKEAIGQPAPAGHWLRVLDVLKECHVLNWMVGGSFDPEDSDLEELWSALMRIGDPESRLSLVESYGSEAVESFEKVLQNCLGNLQQLLEEKIHDKQLLVTIGGLVAVGTPEVERGDALVYIFGMHSPYILRPTGPGCFRLIGPARSYGLVDCRVLDMMVHRPAHKPAVVEELTFVIV